MRDIRDLAVITDAMLRRGYSGERVQKFLGGNLLRVFRQITGKTGQGDIPARGRRASNGEASTIPGNKHLPAPW
jgi:hypothetical protein